jgi:hypothetical protein
MNELYDIIDKIIADCKVKRARNDRDGLLENGQACLEYAYKLTHYSVDMESLYRKFEAEQANKSDENGKRLTGAYAETLAKATDEYREWQRARQVIDILYNLSNMAKALARGVDSSYNAS